LRKLDFVRERRSLMGRNGGARKPMLLCEQRNWEHLKGARGLSHDCHAPGRLKTLADYLQKKSGESKAPVRRGKNWTRDKSDTPARDWGPINKSVVVRRSKITKGKRARARKMRGGQEGRLAGGLILMSGQWKYRQGGGSFEEESHG